MFCNFKLYFLLQKSYCNPHIYIRFYNPSTNIKQEKIPSNRIFPKKLQPIYFVMRDALAANDNVIDEFEQIFQHYSPNTTCRIIENEKRI